MKTKLQDFTHKRRASFRSGETSSYVRNRGFSFGSRPKGEPFNGCVSESDKP